MIKLIKIMLITLSALRLQAQGEVQVSSLAAKPATLDCQQHTTAKVTAQVYFLGVDTSSGSPKNVTLHLAIYSTAPSSNRLSILEEDKTVELRVSPALAEFEVSCSSDTKPGEVTLAASINKAPVGVKIDTEPLFPATVTITGAASTGRVKNDSSQIQPTNKKHSDAH